MSKYQ